MTHNPGEFILIRTSDRLVEIEHPSEHGTMLVSYDVGRRTLDLVDLNVEHLYRRQNIGKELLSYGRYVAEQVGARAVIAAIVSREAYEAARTVFGDESLHVDKLSNFLEPEDGSEPGRRFSSVVTLHHTVDKT